MKSLIKHLGNILNSGIKYLEKLQLFLGVLSLTIFFFVVVIQIFARYLDIPVIWTEEAANYSFIWAVFMGASVMVNKKEHFRFDLLSRKLKGKANIALDIVNNSILLIFNAAIFYYSLLAITSFWNYNWVSVTSLKMGYVLLSLPIMGITMALYSLGHMITSVQRIAVKEVRE